MTLFQCNLAVSKSAVRTEGLAIRHDAYPMRIILLRPVVDDRSAIRKFLVLGQYLSYLVVSHNEHSISSFLARLVVTLRHSAKVLAKAVCHVSAVAVSCINFL